MALRITEAGSETINHGSSTELDDLLQVTLMLWAANLDTTSQYANPFGKAGSPRLQKMASDGTQFQVFMNRGTGGPGNSQFALSNTSTLSNTAGEWQFFGGALDKTNGGPHVFWGNLTNRVADVTNSTQNGNTNASSDAANDLIVGSPEATFGLGMDVAFAAYFNTDLSLVDVQRIWRKPWMWAEHPNCVMMGDYRYPAASTVPDLSGNGNNGTVTSATSVAHCPITPIFWIPSIVPYTVAGGGGGAVARQPSVLSMLGVG